MTSLHIVLDGDGAWPEAAGAEYGEWQGIALLPRNETNPNCVAVKIRLTDGTYVLAQTTAKLFCGAGRTINARLERDEGPDWLDK